MFKEKFYESMNKFEIYKDLYGKPLKRDWVAIGLFPIQVLPIFSKNELLSCLQKVNHVTNYRKKPNHFSTSSSYFYSLSPSCSLTPLPPVLSVRTATNLVELERPVNLTTRSGAQSMGTSLSPGEIVPITC